MRRKGEKRLDDAKHAAGEPGLPALYMTSWCNFCRLVVSAAERLGRDIELRDIDTNADWRQELAAATGRETVPCLRIEASPGELVWMHESRDIIRYLETDPR